MDPTVDVQGIDQKDNEKEFAEQFKVFIRTYKPPNPGDEHYEYIQQLKKMHRLANKRPGTPMEFEHFLFVHQLFAAVRKMKPDLETPDFFIQVDDEAEEIDGERAQTPLPTFDEVPVESNAAVEEVAGNTENSPPPHASAPESNAQNGDESSSLAVEEFYVLPDGQIVKLLKFDLIVDDVSEQIPQLKQLIAQGILDLP